MCGVRKKSLGGYCEQTLTDQHLTLSVLGHIIFGMTFINHPFEIVSLKIGAEGEIYLNSLFFSSFQLIGFKY